MSNKLSRYHVLAELPNGKIQKLNIKKVVALDYECLYEIIVELPDQVLFIKEVPDKDSKIGKLVRELVTELKR